MERDVHAHVVYPWLGSGALNRERICIPFIHFEAGSNFTLPTVYGMMKARILFIILLPGTATGSFAQDWTLINPAYRYNYTTDGSDTIRSQIRVMQVDTLGPDSFRYELNRIGTICDTCPATSNICAGCFVRVDQPQFLGFECLKTGNSWIFSGTDTFKIKVGTTPGSTWAFSEDPPIVAETHSVSEMQLFGVADTVCQITLSNGGNLTLSRSFGILKYDAGDTHLDLIGVEGADVGKTYPDIRSFFDFHPGDELTYRVSSICPVSGHVDYWTTFYDFQKVIITGRIETGNSIDYSTSIAFHGTSYGDCDGPDWPMITNPWTIDYSTILSQHPLLDSYPGQVLQSTIIPGPTRYLAQYGIDTNGNSILSSQPRPVFSNHPFAGFGDVEVYSGVYAFNHPFYTKYQEGLGLVNAEIQYDPGMWEIAVNLVGAIIQGDTVITPPVINWTTGILETTDSHFVLRPNPATDFLTVMGIASGTIQLLILDATGRLVMNERAPMKEVVTLDVSLLPEGLYTLLSIPNGPMGRFVVAR